MTAYFGLMLSLLDTDLSDTARYLLYLAVVTFAPGLALASRVCRPQANVLRWLCLGAGVGYALESFAFVALSALQARAWWAWYPLVGIAALAWLVWSEVRKRPQAAGTALSSPATIWTMAIGIAVVGTVYAVYLAFLSSVQSRLVLIPVGPDLFLHLSTAAEIKHHWPVTDPRLAGFPFSYHYLAHVHLAAASRLTGIDLHILLFRLYIVPLLTLAVWNTYVLTRLFSPNAASAHLAVLMVFFAGTVDVSTLSTRVIDAFWTTGTPVPLGDPWAFVGNSFFSGISPSLVYGLAMFLPLVTETVWWVEEGAGSPFRVASVGLLMAGALLAKGSFMPVYGTGLAIAALWLWRRGEPNWRRAVAATVLSAAVCVPLYFVFLHEYWHGGAAAPVVNPFAIMKQTELWIRFAPVLQSLWESGAVQGVVDGTFRAIALVVAGGLTAIYFLVSFGPRIVGILSYAKSQRWRQPPGAVVILCVIVGSLLPTYLLVLIDDNQLHFLNAAYPLSGILGAAGLAGLIWRAGPSPRRRVVQAAVCGMLLLSTWNSVYAFWALFSSRHVADVVKSSPEVLENADAFVAQRWLRDNTPTDAVVAVNLFSEDDPGLRRRCDYSAFAERRVFLEAVHYERGRDPAEIAFRRNLLKDVFRKGDAAALGVLVERFRVTHLVVDTSDGQPVTLPNTSHVVVQTATVRVYEVGGASHGAAH